MNLSGLGRPYLEACSDYLNPVLQDFEQFDNYTYFVKTVSFLNASDCTFENNVVHFFNSLDDDNLAIFRRRQIGLIYQFYNLIPILNVKENITLPCDLDGKEADKERLDNLIKTLGLEKRVNHLPNQLSGGQQQRVSIGRAMINNPALMLADEPTGNLDSKASEEIISLLKLSNRKFNQTVIIITHDLEIAKEAQRVITIEDGKIIKDERN